MQEAGAPTDRLTQTVTIPATPPAFSERGQPPLPPPKKENKKLLFRILCGLMFVFLVCGGAYYYLIEIFKPPQQAKQIIQLYEDLQSSEQLLGSHKVQDTMDYAITLDILGKREELLLRTQNRLLDITPAKTILPESLSPRAQKIKETFQSFSSLIELAIAANTDAKLKAVFLENAYELLAALGRYAPRVQEARTAVLDPRQPRTVGEVLGEWETRISKAKEMGSPLFAKEPPQLYQVDSSQLKTAWEEASSGFDDILAYLRTQDPTMLISSESIVPQPLTEEVQQQYKGIENVNQFIILLDSSLNNNSAQDLLSYQLYGDVSQQNLQEVGSAFEKQVSELEQLWPQEDRSKKTQAPNRPLGN